MPCRSWCLTSYSGSQIPPVSSWCSSDWSNSSSNVGSCPAWSVPLSRCFLSSGLSTSSTCVKFLLCVLCFFVIPLRCCLLLSFLTFTLTVVKPRLAAILSSQQGLWSSNIALDSDTWQFAVILESTLRNLTFSRVFLLFFIFISLQSLCI